MTTAYFPQMQFIGMRRHCAFCKSGELAGKLTDEFRAEHPGAPWRQIRGMRNIVAHSYGTVDPEITWEILTEDIPKLKTYCKQIIAGSEC